MTFPERTQIKRFGGPIGQLAAVLLVVASQPAYAGKISVDFAANENTGQDFPLASTACAGDGKASCELSLNDNLTSSSINIGFNVDFGSGSVSQVTVGENGVVNIGSGLINVFSTDLESFPANGSVSDILGGGGEIMFARGFADPEADTAGEYDLNQAVDAFHVTWGGVREAGIPRYLQMLLYNQDSGDFDLRLRYGENSADTYALTSAVAGFNLGGNSVKIAGPLVATTDYFYRFRDGLLVTTTTVPEPGTLALLGLGLLGIAWSGRCRVS